MATRSTRFACCMAKVYCFSTATKAGTNTPEFHVIRALPLLFSLSVIRSITHSPNSAVVRFWKVGARRSFRTSELIMHAVNCRVYMYIYVCMCVYIYICIYIYIYIYIFVCVCVCVCVHMKGVHVKSKLQQPGTWLAAARQARQLCYRPAMFFRHLRLIVLSFQHGEFRLFF